MQNILIFSFLASLMVAGTFYLQTTQITQVEMEDNQKVLGQSYGYIYCNRIEGFPCFVYSVGGQSQVLNDASTLMSNPTSDQFCFEYTVRGNKAISWKKEGFHKMKSYYFYSSSIREWKLSSDFLFECLSSITCDDRVEYKCTY